LGGQIYTLIFYGLATPSASLRVEATGLLSPPPDCSQPLGASPLFLGLSDFLSENKTAVIVGCVCFYAGCCVVFVGCRLRGRRRREREREREDDGDVFLS
jgi:hypothetical protein